LHTAAASDVSDANLNRLHLKLGIGKVGETYPFGVLIKLTHNDGSALDELFGTTSSQFEGLNVNSEDGEEAEEKPKQRPKCAVYATFTVSEDANNLDLDEWCTMLNAIVS